MSRKTKPTEIDMKRSDAAALIDAIRVAIMNPKPEEAIEAVRREFSEREIPPLAPCTGEAHSNNCGVCMSSGRWGITGPAVVIR